MGNAWSREPISKRFLRLDRHHHRLQSHLNAAGDAKTSSRDWRDVLSEALDPNFTARLDFRTVLNVPPEACLYVATASSAAPLKVMFDVTHFDYCSVFNPRQCDVLGLIKLGTYARTHTCPSPPCLGECRSGE